MVINDKLRRSYEKMPDGSIRIWVHMPQGKFERLKARWRRLCGNKQVEVESKREYRERKPRMFNSLEELEAAVAQEP